MLVLQKMQALRKMQAEKRKENPNQIKKEKQEKANKIIFEYYKCPVFCHMKLCLP